MHSNEAGAVNISLNIICLILDGPNGEATIILSGKSREPEPGPEIQPDQNANETLKSPAVEHDDYMSSESGGMTVRILTHKIPSCSISITITMCLIVSLLV